MSSARIRPGWATWLYTHNPFYAISVVLMLYAVRAAYGELEIGSINCWIMMAVLAVYTLLLAGIAVAIVRWGKVWDDARSLLLLLLLLFLAVSISADDLFVKSSAPVAGAALVLCGFFGSAGLSELVLRGARIRLEWAYRVPYHLLLALFYAAPWWCSPELNPRSSEALEWTIFLFPTVAAGLFLMLLPAVRRGASAVAGNGTPWPWPWFPWTIFGVIAAAVALRSFVLSLTFGPIGPIWKGTSHTVDDINFATIFGPWFLVPLAFVLLWLVLEGSLASGNRAMAQRMLTIAPLLLAMAAPMAGNQVFQEFLTRFVEHCASPVWITTWLLVAFYGRAWLARVPWAGTACAASLLVFTAVGAETVDLRTLAAEPWPVFTVGALAVFYGARRRSSAYMITGAALLACGLWLVLPRTVAADFRMSVCYHTLWAAIIGVGLACRDRLASALRIVGAVQMPVTAFVVLASSRTESVPLTWRLVYVLTLAAAALTIAVLSRQRWYLYAFAGMVGMALYAGSVIGFRRAVAAFGRPAMTALAWSAGSLLIALLISARKANWLAPGHFPRWLSWGDPATIDPLRARPSSHEMSGPTTDGPS